MNKCFRNITIYLLTVIIYYSLQKLIKKLKESLGDFINLNCNVM